MKNYMSTFISGFGQIIKKKILEDLPEIDIEWVADGLILYRTNAAQEVIRDLRYLNNSFVLLGRTNINSTERTEKIIKKLTMDINFNNVMRNFPDSTSRTFRLIVSKENRMIRADKQLMRNIEQHIINASKLKLNPLKADLEFWFLIRREGQAFFGIRITKLTSTALKAAKGELRSELAHILCLLSDPHKDDVFLDPFCGSGAISMERAKSFPYKKILTGDIDDKSVFLLREKTLSFKNFMVEHLDALNLKDIEDSTINKIITDPPWGFYIPKGKQIDYNWFYSKMLKEFKRVIKPDGKIVVLTGRKELFESLIKKTNIKLKDKYDILVSGKKAGVYVLKV